MSPFELLGLADDADERAIKRAYAQHLRVTRPDEDPQGFQQLHTAYQAALECCRGSDRQPEPVVLRAAASAPVPTPHPARFTQPVAVAADAAVPSFEPPALPRLDPDDFCRAAFALAEAGDAPALQAWLADQPALWALQRKSQLGRYLVQQLHRHEPPMPHACMETLLRFFDLDHALAGHDPLARLKLERRTRLAWQLQSMEKDVLAKRLAIRTSSQRWRTGWIVRQLMRPFRWPRVLFVGMNSANAGLIADFVETVSDRHPEDLPATIDRAQLSFWLAAADRRRITRPRLILGGARSAAMLVLAACLAPLLSQLFAGEIRFGPMMVAAGILMVPSVLWALWMAWSLLVPWYLHPESITAHRSVRPYLVPALCASGVILGAYGQDEAGLVLIAPALWLAIRRYWYRHASRHAFFRSGYTRLMFLLAIPVLHAMLDAKLGTDLVSFGEVIAAVAMVAWAADLRRQRQSQAGTG